MIAPIARWVASYPYPLATERDPLATGIQIPTAYQIDRLQLL